MQKGLYLFSVACLMAIGNNINLTARMDDETTDNVPIVEDLPTQSDDLSVEEQEAYLEEVEEVVAIPGVMPGYIPGQRGIENHDFDYNGIHSIVPLIMDGGLEINSDMGWGTQIDLRSLAQEDPPATTMAQNALMSNFNSAGVYQALENLNEQLNEQDEEDDDEEEEEEAGDDEGEEEAMEEVFDVMGQIVDSITGQEVQESESEDEDGCCLSTCGC